MSLLASAVHRSGPGAGTPLVLLHAFPLDAGMWEPVQALLPDVPVLAIDAPGFGGAAAAPPGLEAFARDVVGAVRGTGAERAVVAGCSMGGYVTAAVAAQAPGLLAGIGLLSTKTTADAADARTRRLAMADAVDGGAGAEVTAPMLQTLLGATSRTERLDVVARVREELVRAPRAGLVWAQRSMAARPDRTADLAALPDGLPALVLRGAEDDLMTDADADAMAAALGVTTLRLPRTGHLAPLEDPAAVAEALHELHRAATG